jgi:hypothetical protein
MTFTDNQKKVPKSLFNLCTVQLKNIILSFVFVYTVLYKYNDKSIIAYS